MVTSCGEEPLRVLCAFPEPERPMPPILSDCFETQSGPGLNKWQCPFVCENTGGLNVCYESEGYILSMVACATVGEQIVRRPS